MTSSPDGLLRTCVYHPPLKNNYSSITEAFLSSEMDEIRNEMLNGVYRKECEYCYYYEDSNQYSCRSDINEKYDIYKNESTTIEKINHFIKNPDIKLRELDISYSNKCNFICVTCNSDLSEGWARRITDNPEMTEFFFDNDYQITNQHEVKLNDIDFQNLVGITLMGGEPTIEKYYDKNFFQMLDENVSHEKLRFQMITNCSRFPHKDWIKFLEKLRYICVGISFDGLNEVGEFCRNGFKMKTWEKNFNKWLRFFIENEKKYVDDRDNGPWINYVLSNYNIFDLGHTLKYFEKYNFRNRIMLTCAFEPKYLCPSYLPNIVKEKLLNELYFYDDNHYEFIKSVLYKNDENEEHIKKFIKYTEYLNFFSHIPENCKFLYKMIKNV